MEIDKGSTKDREILLSSTLNAPVELVWEAWTKPKRIARWWGPHLKRRRNSGKLCE